MSKCFSKITQTKYLYLCWESMYEGRCHESKNEVKKTHLTWIYVKLLSEIIRENFLDCN